MFGLIEDWLFSQLGINYNLNSLGENNIFRDGCVLVNILQKYGLVDDSFSQNIHPTHQKQDCRNNLKLLRPLFEMLKIKYNETVINDIAENKVGTIINLLYELYICLENKQHLYFVTQQNFEKVTQNIGKSLDSVTVNKIKEEVDNNLSSNTCLEQPLIKHRDIIKWYESKYQRVKANLEAKVSKLKKTLPCKEILSLKAMNKICTGKCMQTNNSNVFVDLPALDSFLKSSEDENLLDYKELIAKYKSKQHTKSARKSFETNIQHELLNRTWSKVEEKQNEMYNLVFSSILLKQSQYEKQLLSKLIQAQKEVPIESEHKIWAKQSIITEELDINDREFKSKFEMLEKIKENEEKRVLELHKKLYKEKKEIIKKGNYNLCKDIVDSLVDLSICAAEYKSKHGVEVYKSLWDHWMQLFIKSEPVHVQLQSLEDDISAGNDVDYDSAISFEKELDKTLIENDIDDYLFTCGQWFYSNICLEHGNLIENNLAFIVYRLLTMKYPLPPSPPAADLPPFEIAGILLNFHGTDKIEKLNLLLSKPGIHVFDTEVAVKKCITQFQIETSILPEDKIKGKKKEAKSEKEKSKGSSKQQRVKENKTPKEKGNKKTQKKKSENIEKLEENLKNTEENRINVVEKETQTSIIVEIDDRKTNRTSLGLLGEEVFNKLNQGEKLNDSLLGSVITEYLKSLEEYDGWILLNYPTTLDQASHLEIALTGKIIPMEDYISDEKKTLPNEPCDEWIEHRKSRLLNPPLSETDAQYFKTYFTFFVSIEDEIKNETPTAKQSRISAENDEDNNSLNSQNVREEVNTSPNVLKEFYNNQAIFKEFYSETFDLNSLKQLARLLLKEDGIESKQSTDLFGEEILNKLTKGKKTDNKGTKSLKSKKEKVKENKAGKKKEKTNIEIVPLDQEYNPEVDKIEQEFIRGSEENIENTNQLSTQESKISVITKFVSLPLNNEFGVLLATIWENIESCYINNLKDILFENAVINLRLHPYCTYVQKDIKSITEKQDLKQSLIKIFQEDYNNISNELRTLPEMKNQLHCKVLELQGKLWEISDERKKEAETKRQNIIYENWLVSELCMLINNFLSLVQTEFERSLETLKLVNDYYLNMLEKTPTTMTIQPEYENFDRISEETLTTRKMSGVPESTEKYDDEEVKKNNFIAHGLVYCYEETKTIYLLDDFLSEKIGKIKSNFSSITGIFKAQNKSVADSLASSNKQLTKGKPIVNKEKTSTKPTKEKEKRKISSKPTDREEDGQDKTSTIEALIEEWRLTIQTETERFDFRLDLINERAKENITEFYCFIESVFCSMYKSVLSQYNTEISNINSLCNYLKTAIEEESPLHHPLILERNKFYVGVKETEEKVRGSILKELTEDMHECIFTIQQLSKLISIFKISGPLGIIRKQPLCYILQDLMLIGSCDGYSYLPKIWDSLSELQLRYVIDDIFGLEFGVDWRDFIIYNLNIPYPEVNDILNMRKQFLSYDLEETELISLEDYKNITLWFENELPECPKQGLRYALIKNLLPELFKVDETHISYTALLLYFCKDDNPKDGFKKALSLSLGKNVVTSKSELDMILQREEEIKGIVSSVLRDITDGIVTNRETIQIYEILESFSEMDISQNGSNNNSWEDSLFRSLKSVTSKSSVSKSIPLPPPNSPFTSPSIITQITASKPPGDRKSWVTRIPVASVLSVLNASLFCQDRKFALKNHYLNCLEDEADSDGMIEAYVLIEHSCIQKIFSMTNKYKVSKPCEVIKKCLIEECSSPDDQNKRTTCFLSW